MTVLSRRRVLRWLLGSATAMAALFDRGVVYAQGVRAFTVTATRGAFRVANSEKADEIRVNLGELVRITFEAQDIPHSFTTHETSPHYRIDRRAEPGKPVTFDFRADRAGSVPIICTLTIDPKCKDMRMTLVVIEPK